MDPRVLYNEGKMKITAWPGEVQGHLLHIGEDEYALGREILIELGKRDNVLGFEESLNEVNPEILRSARMAGIPSEQIRFAFNRARIEELEQERSELYAQLISAGDDLDNLLLRVKEKPED